MSTDQGEKGSSLLPLARTGGTGHYYQRVLSGTLRRSLSREISCVPIADVAAVWPRTGNGPPADDASPGAEAVQRGQEPQR